MLRSLCGHIGRIPIKTLSSPTGFLLTRRFTSQPTGNMASAWKRATSDVIDFGIGQPSKNLLPMDLISDAVSDVAKRCRNDTFDVRDVLQYGDNSGQAPVLESIAKWLSKEYESDVSADRLFLTNGSSSALEIVCATLTQPGDLVLIEDPTYFLALSVFNDHSLRCLPVPADHNGLDLEALEDILDQNPEVKFIYTIPSYGNPSSSTMPLSARKKFAAILEKRKLLAVTDDVYQSLYFPTPTGVSQKPPSVMSSICPDWCISLGSFSKLLAPGLRFGWVQSPERVHSAIQNRGYVNSGGGLHPFAGAIVYSLVESGRFDVHLDALRKTLGERKGAMCEALRVGLAGTDVTFTDSDGGYFVWLTCPGRDMTALMVDCKEAGVSYTPGSKASVDGKAHGHCARLSFAYYNIDEIQLGIDRLCTVLKKQT
ncbi:hypothetical protein SARC_00131 [Sphaeroforma arctica JP610]|uniref:Aminotransferase class I/classII large domain-containing protein n=1 Tax=Sphaeroforma arctica JP610 TaxID=667725 RepID=A0A0L0GFX8_9EUKA|nr:hypothetical protein SARC_00131 [Sphaeroforma arctica JP610]KNC87759.1 hypothetical protein SARC_00131 [Sphaeroforma arctica JP610]|eukprot:XP_014161661.1 hypothetical protein SARC_00131 [Sphaeroforma arctica JP610]